MMYRDAMCRSYHDLVLEPISRFPCNMQTQELKHLLFILIDGVGIPSARLTESIYSKCPNILDFLSRHCIPIDAALDVSGPPQSATGQTAIFTGCNAPRKKGAHLSGFPDRELREIIRQNNFYLSVLQKGKRCIFSNAYVRYAEQNLPVTLQSVTTVAAKSALPRLLTKDDLINGKAVYHDPTRAYLREHGLPDIPVITEEQAADDLISIMRGHDLTVFEYFLTDHAAHRGTEVEMRKTLASLDRLLGQLMKTINTDHELLLWSSDHGNIEEPATRTHSRNQVPLCAYGKKASYVLENAGAITDIAPIIISLL